MLSVCVYPAGVDAVSINSGERISTEAVLEN